MRGQCVFYLLFQLSNSKEVLGGSRRDSFLGLANLANDVFITAQCRVDYHKELSKFFFDVNAEAVLIWGLCSLCAFSYPLHFFI